VSERVSEWVSEWERFEEKRKATVPTWWYSLYYGSTVQIFFLPLGLSIGWLCWGVGCVRLIGIMTGRVGFNVRLQRPCGCFKSHTPPRKIGRVFFSEFCWMRHVRTRPTFWAEWPAVSKILGVLLVYFYCDRYHRWRYGEYV